MRFSRILLLVSLLALVATPVALALRFTDESFNTPTGETGKPYFHKFGGAAGCGPALPYQYRLLSGELPPGLTLHKDGTLDGTPTSTGDYHFYVELSDEDPPSQSWCRPSQAQRDFTIHVIQGLNIEQRQSSLGGAFVNQAYTKQLSASGAGSSALIWSIVGGSLPTGLSINQSTGQISGTPTQTGDFTFKVKVTDGTRQDQQTYTLSIVQPLQITSAARATGLPNTPFTFQLTATGGKTPYKWTAEGLPTGLNLDPNAGAVTGTSATPGSFTVKVTLTDALGLQQTQNVTIAIGAKLAIARQVLPTLKVGKKYRARLVATGGVAPKTWAIIGGRPGTLPPGIKFSTRTGVFSGTPSKAGTWRLRMQVTDGAGAHVSIPVVLKVLH